MRRQLVVFASKCGIIGTLLSLLSLETSKECAVMSETNVAPQATSSPRKKRHPLEFVLVWGLIAVLVGLAGIEFRSYYGHRRAIDELGKKLADVEEPSGQTHVYRADVESVVPGMKPARIEKFGLDTRLVASGATRLEVYSWFTINPLNPREMFVYYGIDDPDSKDGPEVLSVRTDEDEDMPFPRKEMEIIEKAQKAGRGPGSKELPIDHMKVRAGMPAMTNGNRRGAPKKADG